MPPLDAPLLIGLDIGGTKLMVAAADLKGRILRREKRPTPAGLAAGLSALHEMIGSVRRGERIAAIGAALGGPLDHERGVVSPLHQPEWREVPFKALFETRYACPVALDVDTNIAALGEYAADPERPDRLLYLTLSTGMGGGFVVDGQIYRGAGGAHPEVAHQSIPSRCRFPERVRCACGLQDCLEGLVSGNGIRRVYGRPAEELKKEDWGEVAWNLGQGLRNLAVIYAPGVIALGGGVALGGGARLVTQTADVMRASLRLVPPPEIRLSLLGYDTALVGAITAAGRQVSSI